MIFVSTGGNSSTAAVEYAAQLGAAGIRRVELSGGCHCSDQLEQLIKMRQQFVFQVHNYFPPPKVPFVFNLGSLDDDVAGLSLRHVETAMQWSIQLGRPLYSFHAGFLIDPRVDELGRRIKSRTIYDRSESLKRFIERLNLVGERAGSLGVSLLVENNVLSANNYSEFRLNPFLMTSADECTAVMSQTPDNVRMLVDVAHLKVSALSLGFDAVEFLTDCDAFIDAYHLSDNDGTRDSNEPFTESSWFWPHLKRDLDYYSIEVYRQSPEKLVEQLKLAEKQLQ